MSKPVLLIVDDDEAIRTQMKWALAEEYEVALAEDRVSAMQAFGEKRPEIVLLDLGLPPRPNTPALRNGWAKHEGDHGQRPEREEQRAARHRRGGV